MKLSQRLSIALWLCCLVSAGLAQTGNPSTRVQKNLTDVTFKDVEVKEAIMNLGRQLKLNVVFDDSVRIPGKLSLELKDVTLEATLRIIFVQQKLRASWIETNTVIVYADNAQLRQRFAEYNVWEPKTSQRQ
jgi:type II secretory pathway component GspD/PulD (secretin)